MMSCVQWRKLWFVLDDVGLKYYRDVEEEEVTGSL